MGRFAPRADGGFHVEEEDRRLVASCNPKCARMHPRREHDAVSNHPRHRAGVRRSDGGTGHVPTGALAHYGGGANTSKITVAGAATWCSDPQCTSPHSGDYPVRDVHTRPNPQGQSHPDAALRAIVYHSFGPRASTARSGRRPTGTARPSPTTSCTPTATS